MNNFSSAIKEELLYLAQLEQQQQLALPEAQYRKQNNHSYLSEDGSFSNLVS